MNIKDFLTTSYTAYHATANARARLVEAGFAPLVLGKPWHLEWGKGYFLERNGSALLAFRLGKKEDEFVFHLAESHTDSPSLKIKGNQLLDSPEGKRLNVEAYGGGLWYSFLDIPLRIAGRVLVEEKGRILQKTVASECLVNIPSLCVHHGGKDTAEHLSLQNDMLPLVGTAESVYALVGEPNAIDGDLYVVPAVEPHLCGADGGLLVSPRIDNLTSVWASVEALVSAEPKGVAVAVLWDNEEIGSGTKQGAHSAWLPQVLGSIARNLGKSEDEYLGALARGMALSIDNGHAVHPAHPEKSDPKERVYLDKGIVIKHHAHYSTDGVSSAVLKKVLDKRDIPYQDYYNHSDTRCGGTLGLVTSAQLAMDAVDIGLAQLAMHSAVETVALADVSRMQEAVRAFFEIAPVADEEGWRLQHE